MNPQQFAESLQRLAPTRSKLAAAGYSDDESEQFIASFVCVRRRFPLDLETHGDDVLQLVREWDVSSVEIGMFSFLATPVVTDARAQVGILEVDPVSHRSVDGGYVLEEVVSGRFICRVAPSGCELLGALLEIAGFYAKSSVGEIDLDDDAMGLAVKQRCVDLLGGDEYETFCTMLLGV
jgi:hypothetical protein